MLEGLGIEVALRLEEEKSAPEGGHELIRSVQQARTGKPGTSLIGCPGPMKGAN